MAKVLLIVPTHGYKTGYPKFLGVTDFPSGIAYIASALDGENEVYGLNLNNIVGYATAFDMVKDLIIDALQQVEPDVIGMGGLCVDYKFLKDAIGIIRENSKAKIVLGGNIVTGDGEFIFKTLKPDYAIEGEGEETMKRLCKGGDVKDIPNLWYWED